MFQFKVWWRRSLLYRLSWLSSSLLILWLLMSVATLINEKSPELIPRLMSHGHDELWLELDELTARERDAITSSPYGVPVTLIRPQFKLIGSLKELDESGPKPRLKLGIYPHELKQLHVDSSLRLMVEAPSLSLFLEDFKRSPRGRVAIERLKAAWRLAQIQFGELLALLGSELRASIPEDLLERLSSDPVVTERLGVHFESEVIDQIDWSEIFEDVLESEEFEHLRQSALRGIKWRTILGEALSGAVGPKQGPVKQVPKQQESMINRILKRIKDIPRKASEGASKQVTQRLTRDVKRNLERDAELLKREGKALLIREAKAAQLQTLTARWVEAVAQDPALLSHLRAEYQPELIDGAREALSRFTARPELKLLLAESWLQLLEALKSLSRALLFNHSLDDPGPNPLLIAVIEELVSGELSPSVQIFGGVGAEVSSGHVFKQSAPDEVRGGLELIAPHLKADEEQSP